MATRPKRTLDPVKGTDDYYEDDRRDDVITQASQVDLFQDINMIILQKTLKLKNIFLSMKQVQIYKKEENTY
jgi:hypothetical protein